jgi:N-acetylglucosamine malate deacetylase 1
MNAKTMTALTKMIDELKPRAIFTHWPVDGHADHVQAAAVTANAWRFAKHRPERYFFEVQFAQTANYRPLYYIDVTSTITNKLTMLRKYACQNAGDEISKDNLARAEQRGREAGFAYAETFTSYDGKPVAGGILEPLKKKIRKD